MQKYEATIVKYPLIDFVTELLLIMVFALIFDHKSSKTVLFAPEKHYFEKYSEQKCKR